MKRFLKLMVLLIVVAAVAGVVASLVSRRKFMAMSDDEIRSFLAGKLEGKVDDDQLASIQDAVIAGVRARSGSATDHYVEDVTEAVEELEDLAAEVEVEEAAETAAALIDDAEAAIEEAIAES